jgi:PAS domain S-box-containing protein
MCTRMHALPDLRDLFRELVTRAREPMIITDVHGVIRFENGAAALSSGHDADDRVGRPIFEYIHPDDHQSLRAALARNGDPRDPATLLDCRIKHVDGRTIAIELTVAVIECGGDATRHVLMHVHDVSERLDLLARLRHAHKLAALGHLTSGVADDLARVMATIRSQLDHLPTSEAPPFFLRVVRRAAETGVALAQQLKAFAEMPPPFREQVDVHALLAEVRRSITTEAWLDVMLEAYHASVRTDRDLLRHGLVDLIVGFSRALDDGSVVSITTHNRSISRQVPWRSRTMPVEYLVIEIANGGRGTPVPPARTGLDSALPPPMSAGIVLALLSLDDVSSNAGGYVEVSSNGAGITVVAIYLPVQ